MKKKIKCIKLKAKSWKMLTVTYFKSYLIIIYLLETLHK